MRWHSYLGCVSRRHKLIVSHKLSAHWDHPLKRSDFSIPASVVSHLWTSSNYGIDPFSTIDILFELFHSSTTKVCVWSACCYSVCISIRTVLTYFYWWCLFRVSLSISSPWYLHSLSCFPCLFSGYVSKSIPFWTPTAFCDILLLVSMPLLRKKAYRRRMLPTSSVCRLFSASLYAICIAAKPLSHLLFFFFSWFLLSSYHLSLTGCSNAPAFRVFYGLSCSSNVSFKASVYETMVWVFARLPPDQLVRHHSSLAHFVFGVSQDLVDRCAIFIEKSDLYLFCSIATQTDVIY